MLRNIVEYALGFSIALVFFLMLAYSFFFDALPACISL
jgi:hypothetical protein